MVWGVPRPSQEPAPTWGRPWGAGRMTPRASACAAGTSRSQRQRSTCEKPGEACLSLWEPSGLTRPTNRGVALWGRSTLLPEVAEGLPGVPKLTLTQ